MSKSTSLHNKGLQTKLVRGGTMRSNFGEASEALFLNSGFCYESAEVAESRFNGEDPGFVYSRYLNPTLAMLEERLTLLEGAEAACVMASGMAAVFGSMMCFLKTGDHVVANRVLFGSCYYIITEVLPRFGISYTLVDDVANEEAWKKAITDKTSCIFIETPSNPTLTVVDIEAVAKIAHARGAKVIVDNIFATPMYQKPLALGADAVVYSTTKHMDGQGRTLGGAVLGPAEFITETLLPFHRHTGPALSPFNAWVVLKSLETFEMRVERHTDNAEAVAHMLENHPKVERVYYPHLKSHPQYDIAKRQMTRGGALIAFAVKGGKEAAFRMMNKMKIIDICNNLGDSKSLMTHPATTTHSNIPEANRNDMGITDNVVRLSVGIESKEDLIEDLEQALEVV